MIRKAATAVLLWICVVPSASAQPAPLVGLPAPQALTAEPRVSYPDGVIGLQAVPFKLVAGYRAITLDLYGHTDTGKKKPLVLWIHGGGWKQGGTRENPGYPEWTHVLAHLAARGFVVAAVDYRLSGEARFPAALDDITDALNWLRTNAALYGIDADNITLWGASSGAHLAALAGTSCAARGAPCPRTVVDWFGPTSFSIALEKPAPGTKPTPPSLITGIEEFLGCKLARCGAATMRAVDPIASLTAKAPSFRIMHGDEIGRAHV